MLCNSDEDLDNGGGVHRRRRRRAHGRCGHLGRVAARVDAARRCSHRGIPVVAVDRRPARRRGRLGRRRQPARRARPRPRTSLERRCDAHRVHHRPEPRRHRERTACTATATRSRAPGCRSTASLVRRADFKEDGGYRAARSLLEQPTPPDALFVANHPMTVGALRALRELGRRVPDDVAIVGFDDSPLDHARRARSSPSSTQPAYEIGRAAAELLATAGDATGAAPRRAARRRSSSARARSAAPADRSTQMRSPHAPIGPDRAADPTSSVDVDRRAGRVLRRATATSSLDRITTDEEVEWLRARVRRVRSAAPQRVPRRAVRRRAGRTARTDEPDLGQLLFPERRIAGRARHR